MSLPLNKQTLVEEIRECRRVYNMFIQGFNSNLKTLASGKTLDNGVNYPSFWAHYLFDWCMNIDNIVAFQYQRGLKEKVVEWLEEMRLKDGSELYYYTSEHEWRVLADRARDAVEAIWDIPFIEHIALE